MTAGGRPLPAPDTAVALVDPGTTLPDQPVAAPSVQPVTILAGGDRAVAAGTIVGDVITGDGTLSVSVAPGALPPAALVPAPGPGLSNLPRRPSPAFAGRSTEVTALVAALDSAADCAVVTGGGGTGKSELVLQHAAPRCVPGAVVWWVTADTALRAEGGLAALAAALEPAIGVALPAPMAADWALSWLQSHTGWLLVLDNVEDPALVMPLLGRLRSGDVVITSRVTGLWAAEHLPEVRLGPLAREASVALLLSAPGEDGTGRAAADALAHELADNPLALAQAVALMVRDGLGLPEYLARVPRTGTTGPAATAEGAVRATSLAALESVTSQVPASRTVMRALARLAADALPRDAVPDGDRLALEPLASYGLVSLTPDTVGLHRVLQEILRAEDDRDAPSTGLSEGRRVALSWLTAALPDSDPAVDVGSWPRWRALAPHVLALFDTLPDSAAAYDANGDILARLTGNYLLQQGRFAEAVALARRDLALTRAGSRAADDLIVPLNNVAETLRRSGATEAAVTTAREAMDVVTRAGIPEDARVALVANTLGLALVEAGYESESRTHLERALSITESRVGPHDLTLVYPLNNMGHVLRVLGDPRAAVPHLQRSIVIAESYLGITHPSLVPAVNNLGTALVELGDPASAMPLLERAVLLAEQTYGRDDHPDLVMPLSNLGHCLRMVGRPGDAVAPLERSVAIAVATYGPDHPASRLPESNLGLALSDIRDPRAREHLERAALLCEQHMPPGHPDTFLTWTNLAADRVEAGRLGSAREAAGRALAVLRAAPGAGGPIWAPKLEMLVRILDVLGDSAEAGRLRALAALPA